MRNIVIIICFIFGINSYAQNTEEEYLELLEQAALDEDYLQFTKKVSDFYYSDENMYQKYYEKAFFDKLGSENVKETCTMPVTEFKEWVSNNLSKTNFSSVEEAISLHENFWKYDEIKRAFIKKVQPTEDMYKEKYGLVIHHDFNNILLIGENGAYNRFLEKMKL